MNKFLLGGVTVVLIEAGFAIGASIAYLVNKRKQEAAIIRGFSRAYAERAEALRG